MQAGQERMFRTQAGHEKLVGTVDELFRRYNDLKEEVSVANADNKEDSHDPGVTTLNIDIGNALTRLRTAEDELKRSVVAKTSPSLAGKEVQIGSFVFCRICFSTEDWDHGRICCYHLVGWRESYGNRSDDVIGVPYTAPIGSSMFGAEVGEEVESETPNGPVILKILRIIISIDEDQEIASVLKELAA